MTSSVEAVRRVVERDGAIKNILARGLINISALARFIQDTVNQEGEQFSLDALISSIRRYSVPETMTTYKNLAKYFSQKKLMTRDKIADVAIPNDPSIPSSLARFSSQINYGRGETLRIVSGIETIRVVIDEKNLDKITKVIPKQNIKEILRNLTEIMISLPEATFKMPGVVSAITSELAMNGISMIECMSCGPDITIVIEEKDAIKAYQAIQRLGSNI